MAEQPEQLIDLQDLIDQEAEIEWASRTALGFDDPCSDPEHDMPSCDADVWDGPYKMRCGHLLFDGKCVRHGKRPAAPPRKERD